MKLKSEKTKLDLGVCDHRFWAVLGQIFVFRVKNPCPGGSPGQPLFLRYEIEKRLRAV